MILIDSGESCKEAKGAMFVSASLALEASHSPERL